MTASLVTHHHVQLLGKARVFVGSETHDFLDDMRYQCLAYLVAAHDWVRRDELIYLFWPDIPQKKAQDHLRQLLKRMRKLEWLTLENKAGHIRCLLASDLAQFRGALSNHDWQKALACVQGIFLEGLEAGPSEFMSWLEQERGSLMQLQRKALIKCIDDLAHQPAKAQPLIEAYREKDPLDEDLLQHHLRCLAQLKQFERLVQVYRDFQGQLMTELALEPSPETILLFESLQALRLRHPRTLSEQTTQPTSEFSSPSHYLNEEVFVGRDNELHKLHDHFKRVRAGQGTTLVIEGEAGVGKTHLVETFLQQLSNTSVFTGRCFERDLSVPLEPIHEAFKHLSSMNLPNLLETEGFWASDPQDRSSIHQGFTAQLFKEAKGVNAVVLFIDDLQWADTATLEFLSYAAKRVKDEAIFIITSYRREDRASLAQWLSHLAERRIVSSLKLTRLEFRQTEALLIKLFKSRSEDIAYLAEFVHHESEGNPYYVMEYLRWLADTKVIEFDDGRTLTVQRAQLPEAILPEGIRSLIWARYQGLSEATRAVLNLVIVIGRSFTFTLLERSSLLEPMILWADFEPLLESGFIIPLVDDSYVLSHDKLRQTLYDGLAPPLRRNLHRQIAQALQQDRSSEDAELAHHFLRAQVWSQAFTHLDGAAQKAEENFSWEMALQGYDSALNIVDHLPDAERKRFKLLQAKERLLENMDRRPERVATIAHMIALAEHLKDSYLLAEAQMKQMSILIRQGDKVAAQELCEQALHIFAGYDDRAAMAKVHRELAYTYWANNDYNSALEASFEALHLYKQLEMQTAEAATLWNIAQAYRHLESHEEALSWAQKAAVLNQELGNELGNYMHLDALAWIHEQRGDSKTSISYIEQLIVVCERLGDKHLTLEKHMSIGQYYFKHHQPQEALKHFEAAAQLGADIGDPRHEGYPLMGAAASYNYLGDSERAGQAYRRASQLMKSAYAVNAVAGEHISQADALTLLADSLQHKLENHDEVILSFQLAESIYQHHASLASLSKLLMNRASFHWRNEQLSQSASDYEQARQLAQQEGLQAREAAALASLGAVYRRLERYEDSIRTSLDALKILRRVDDKQAEAYVLSSLASTYRLSGKLADAQSCLLRSLELRERIGDTNGAATVLDDLAELGRLG